MPINAPHADLCCSQFLPNLFFSILHSHDQAKRGAGPKEREEDIRAGVKRQRKKAQEELENDHEERAKQVTAASLANVSLNYFFLHF